MKNQKVVHGLTEAKAVLVLPKNYGWGMRYTEDRIWDWGGPDEKSDQIWKLSCQLLERYGTQLDIVYDDPEFSFQNWYPKIYYWNHTHHELIMHQ